MLAEVSCGLDLRVLRTASLIMFTAAPESISADILTPLSLMCVRGCLALSLLLAANT